MDCSDSRQSQCALSPPPPLPPRVPPPVPPPVAACQASYGSRAQLVHDDQFEVMLLEPRPFRPFKTSEEYLYAMKEDLADWLNTLYGLDMNVDNFMKRLETGVALCRHANHVLKRARECEAKGRNSLNIAIPARDVVLRENVSAGTFQARDNVSNFIAWCRSLQIHECLLFESDDLVMRKNEKSFILCLLEVARRGSKFGILAPTLVKFEEEIDRELELEENKIDKEVEQKNDDKIGEITSDRKQVITNDLRTLHERVVELLSRCTCPTQYILEYISDGKYRIGDTKVLIFVRILRNHVMVRVGGGWDTLEHYLDKHDPCRCRSGHRYALSAKLSLTHYKGNSCSPQMQVTYNRPTEATTPASFQKRLTGNSRDASPTSSPLKVSNHSTPECDPSDQSRRRHISNPDVFVQNNQRNANFSNSLSFDGNGSRKSRYSPQSNLSAPQLNDTFLMPYSKSNFDSSSSEISESEYLFKNSTIDDLAQQEFASNCIKKCSPKKILKTNKDFAKHNNKRIFARRRSESDESSITSDEIINSAYNLQKMQTKIPSILAQQRKAINKSNERKFSNSRDNCLELKNVEDIKQKKTNITNISSPKFSSKKLISTKSYSKNTS